MKFPYSSVISILPDSGDLLLFRRPEIPVTVIGPKGLAAYIALVDTGSDNTVFPKSVADHLGIDVEKTAGPHARAYGGHRVELFAGEALLKLDDEGETLLWRTSV